MPGKFLGEQKYWFDIHSVTPLYALYFLGIQVARCSTRLLYRYFQNSTHSGNDEVE